MYGIIYGQEAMKILREAKTMQSEKSKRNGKKLVKYFERFIRKED